MKICIINNRYKPFQTGGAEKIAELTTNELIKSGNEISIITTRPFKANIINQAFGPRIYYWRSLFLSLDKIPKIFRLFWHIVDMFNFFSLLFVYKILKKEKPELVITHNIKGIGQLSFWAIRLLKLKHIHYIHDIQLLHPSGLIVWGQERKMDRLPAKIYRCLSKFMIGSPDLIVSPSKWLLIMHEKFKFFKDSKKEIIFNPIDLKYINTKISQETAKDHGHFRLLYIGHMTYEKGFDFLLAAFDVLKKEIANIELVLIGNASGEAKEKLKIKNDKKIKFLGFVPPDEVIENMLQSSLFVMPCLNYENSPTVIYEAVSMGVPVLAAQIGGITELVEYFGGSLFKPGDKDDFIEKAIWIFNNYSQAKAGAEKAKGKINNFDLKNYINTLLAELK